MKENIPALLLKKLSLLPLQEVRIELNNELSKKVIDLSIAKYNNKILVLVPNNLLEESPSLKDLPKTGVLTQIKSCIELPSGNYRVVISGVNRVNVLGYSNDNNGILISNIKKIYIAKDEGLEEEALKQKLNDLTKLYIKLNPEVSNSILNKIKEAKNLDKITDLITSFINLPKDKKMKYINEFDEKQRAKYLIEDITIELEIIKLNNKLEKEIRTSFENEQREFIIKAKIDKLNEELGIIDHKASEIKEYEEKIKSFKAPKEIKVKLETELNKYKYTPDNNPDASVIRNYIDTLLSVPYKKYSKEEQDIKKVKTKLDETHYGVNHVKERMIEYASLKALNKELINPVICLIGAPGVGKTTLAMSISKALKRNFFKISVGGLNDSSELIGHRRTYLGASPGKIMSAIIKSKTSNPVILIDEVDKMVKDYKGDPASVLLDVLDENMNKTFVDNYIEEAFDLSNTLFILTANDESQIPPALKDRLEIMHIDSYTVFDKKDIAQNYLIDKICEKYKHHKIKIKDEDIIYIINNYTMESGVRDLERLLDKLIRNVIINKKDKIDIKYIKEILKTPLYENIKKENKIGEVNALGVCPMGGRIISIQSALIPNESGILITGKTDDSTKDNIDVVISYLKINKLIKEKDLKENKIHVNFNEDVKLGGASGSLGVAASILSLFKNKKIKDDISFTGKIDLHGDIKKVSSVKEKIITSYNNNIKKIYLPKENINDIKEIPEFILKEIDLKFINNFNEVVKDLFND